MATTLRQVEAAPEDILHDLIFSVTLSPAAVAVGRDTIWQRLESYIAYRWTPRAVVWTVEGPGEWRPTLTPATIDTVEVWDNGAWVETFDAMASPYGGFFLPGCGPYRFTATVGGGEPEIEPPQTVLEAFRRLGEHLGTTPDNPGARRESVNIGTISQSLSRHEAWVARAMQNSGAGDLLRPFRRAP